MRVVTIPERRIRFQIEVSGDEPLWLPPVIEEFMALLRLPPNWNSYGAQQIDPKTVQFALEILLATMRPDTPRPILVPTSRGGVQLEWHTRGVDLEVEILEPGRLRVSYEEQRGGTEWEAELTSNLAPLVEPIARLSRLN